jgi:hypothetical protein
MQGFGLSRLDVVRLNVGLAIQGRQSTRGLIIPSGFWTL